MTELHFNVALLKFKLLQSVDRNISSKKWLRDLFFNEDSNISPMILQSHVEHTLGEKIIIP